MVSSPFSGRRGFANLFKDSSHSSRSRNHSRSSLQLADDDSPSRSSSASSSRPHMSRSQSMSSYSHMAQAPAAPPHSKASLSDRPLPSIPSSPSGLSSRSSSRGVAPDSKYKPKDALPPVPRLAPLNSSSSKQKDTFYKRLSRAAAAAFAPVELPPQLQSSTSSTSKKVETDEDLAETYAAYLSLEGSDISSGEARSHVDRGAPAPAPNTKDDNNSSSSTTTSSDTPPPARSNTKKRSKSDARLREACKLDQQHTELEQRCQKLQHMLETKESEYQKISTSFHKHMMSIRATDDDYSTIRSKLTMLQSKIAALPLALKKNALDFGAITRFFLQTWPELAPTIEALTDKTSHALGYNTICMLVEKLIMQSMVTSIYDAPVYIGLPTNDAYVEITRYMDPHDRDWSVRLRQQLCKLAHRSATTTQQDDPVAKSIADAKHTAVMHIVDQLLHVYDDRQALEARVGKLVETAAELSLAMHSQEAPVDPFPIAEGSAPFDPELMATQNGSLDEAATVCVAIAPPFVYNESSRQCVLVKAKVICL